MDPASRTVHVDIRRKKTISTVSTTDRKISSWLNLVRLLSLSIGKKEEGQVTEGLKCRTSEVRLGV